MKFISALLTTSMLTATACAQPASTEDVTVLNGATLIDGRGGSLEDGVLVISGDAIVCAGAAEVCDIPGDADIIDVSGHFITPGLVDGHVHVAQTGWLDGRPDGIEDRDVYPYEETIAALRANPGRWHQSYLCSGITAVVDPGGPPWSVTDEVSSDGERDDRAHVISAGPLITHAGRNQFFTYGSLEDQPLFLPMDSDEEVRENIAFLQETSADAIKVWYLDPPEGREEELYQRLMLVGELADEAGLELWVHATQLRNAKAALEAGAEMLVHSVEDEPVDEEFLDLLLANNAVYAPTLRVGRNWRRALSSVAMGDALAVDDPNGCVDEAILERINTPERLQAALGGRIDANAVMNMMIANGAEEAIMAANLKTVYEAGGRIVTSTDAGNPLTLHGPSIYAEMEAMQAAGIPAMEVISMSTYAGAELMGHEDDFGSLESGKVADLLVLAEDPRENVAAFRSLTHVMRAGTLYTQEELRVRDIPTEE